VCDQRLLSLREGVPTKKDHTFRIRVKFPTKKNPQQMANREKHHKKQREFGSGLTSEEKTIEFTYSTRKMEK